MQPRKALGPTDDLLAVWSEWAHKQGQIADLTRRLLLWREQRSARHKPEHYKSTSRNRDKSA